MYGLLVLLKTVNIVGFLSGKCCYDVVYIYVAGLLLTAPCSVLELLEM